MLIKIESARQSSVAVGYPGELQSLGNRIILAVLSAMLWWSSHIMGLFRG